MKTKIGIRAAAALGSLALLGLAPFAHAGVTATILSAPFPASFSLNCLGATGSNGGLGMIFSINCRASTGIWTPWLYGEVNLPWSPNPGSGENAYWFANQPANTYAAAHLVSFNEDGTIASSAGWVTGGGWQWSGVSGRGNGAQILEVAFTSANGQSSVPSITVVGADMYAF